MTFALELARQVNGRKHGDVPADVLRAATIPIADTIGVAIAGAGEAPVDKLGIALGELAPGPCTLLGRVEQTSAERAIMLNAMAAHALDFDDSSQVSGAHPSAALLPVALALAEECGCSGLMMIDAYVTGFETMARLGRSVMPAHYERGWHPTSTLGVFGAAAAAARIIKLDHERFATALAIAVSLSGGVKSNFGTDTKPFHAAAAAWKGALAARLAAAGLSAGTDAFEHKHGFFNVFHGVDVCRPEAALEARALSDEFCSPGIAIKQHPCCGSTHSIIDAVLKLRERVRPMPVDRIASVRTRTHVSRLAHTDRPDPRTDSEAKFSLQYVTARAIMDGAIRLDHFRNGAFEDPAVRALMAHTEAEAHKEADPFLGTVTITMNDGEVLEEQASTEFGRDARAPLSSGQLFLKFEDCLRGAGCAGHAAALYGALMDLHARAIRDVAHSVRSCIPPARF
ncbi:MmgE/PrpD family protein [Pseudochelatococcus sp. B33]